MTLRAGDPSRRKLRVTGGRWCTPFGAVLRGGGLFAFVVLLTVASAGVVGAAVRRDPGPLLRSQQHVVICHALGNGGYTRINPAVDSVVSSSGHSGHPRDIIPPFDYVLSNGTTGSFPGLNWPSGEATWLNGCVTPPPLTGTIAVLRKCVTVNANGTFDATFGYQSSASAPVTLSPDSDNALTPDAYQGRQGTITFAPGPAVPAAFTVTNIAAGTTLTWTVTYNGHTSSVSMTSSDPECDGEGPPPDETIHPISVFVTCVANHGSTYDAVFGYNSENTVDQAFPVSEANAFSPGDQDRGQPTLFLPGVHEDAVTVRGIPASEELTWTLAFQGTFEAVASASFESKCGQPIEPPPTGEPPPQLPRPIGIFVSCVSNHGRKFDATFGYVNENVGEVAIPIGSNNGVAPGPAAQGQPDTFLPGSLNAAFTVRGVSASRAVTWTIRFDDTERVATANASFPEKCLTARIHPVAGAQVTKTAAPGTVRVGQRVTFTIEVRNTRSKVLRPARVTDTLPAGLLRVLSATSTLATCRVTTSGSSPRVECGAPALAPGQSLTIHITARATGAGTASDHAAVIGVRQATANATVRITSRGVPPTAPPPPVTG